MGIINYNYKKMITGIVLFILAFQLSFSVTLDDDVESPFSDTDSTLTIENMNTIWNKIRYLNFADGIINMGGYNITNVGQISLTSSAPTEDQHVVTKEWVETKLGTIGASGSGTDAMASGAYMCYGTCQKEDIPVCATNYELIFIYGQGPGCSADDNEPASVDFSIGSHISGEFRLDQYPHEYEEIWIDGDLVSRVGCYYSTSSCGMCCQ
jgi:hypothetical protein